MKKIELCGMQQEKVHDASLIHSTKVFAPYGLRVFTPYGLASRARRDRDAEAWRHAFDADEAPCYAQSRQSGGGEYTLAGGDQLLHEFEVRKPEL